MHESPIKRRLTRKIRVGNIFVGGDAPITVQTMTNTETLRCGSDGGTNSALCDGRCRHCSCVGAIDGSSSSVWADP